MLILDLISKRSCALHGACRLCNRSLRTQRDLTLQAVKKEDLDSIYEGCSVKVVFDRPAEQVLEVGCSLSSLQYPQVLILLFNSALARVHIGFNLCLDLQTVWLHVETVPQVEDDDASAPFSMQLRLSLLGMCWATC